MKGKHKLWTRLTGFALALALVLVMAPAAPAAAYDMGKVGQNNIISAGGEHTAAIDANGGLWMWGSNEYGQLGNGTRESSDVPIKVMENVASVNCGYGFTAAIKTDGSLWMWGSNWFGQLGNGLMSNTGFELCQTVPVKIMDNVAAVACGDDHTAAIKTDGTLWMWGNNECGQLGDGTTEASLVPKRVMYDVAAVSCGWDFTAAITTDGSLWMWGSNEFNELGTGSAENSYVPVKIMDDVATVSCGILHTAAVKSDGSLWVWGVSYPGNGTSEFSSIPTKVMDDVVTVSCGWGFAAAITTDSSLWMWGGNYYGQLGTGTTKDASIPIEVMDDVAAVACGNYYTAIVQTDGTLWSWGSNDCGQLGIGSTDNALTPTLISGLTASPSDIGSAAAPETRPNVAIMGQTNILSAGGVCTGFVDADGGLWMWGDNASGQLGNGTQEDSSLPIKVMDDVASVSCGNSHTAAIKTDGSLWVWGSNSRGQLGNGHTGVNSKGIAITESSSVPIKIMDDVVVVSCGNGYTAAIKTDGSLWMWGDNSSGQLGTGGVGNATYDIYDSPIQIIPVKVMENVTAVNCGAGFTAVVKIDGTLWMWGDNRFGQLGNGGTGNATTSYGTPIQTVPVKIMDNVTTVSCGDNHTAAITIDGSLWIWGGNVYDQLGNGGVGNAEDKIQGFPIQTVPVRIMTGVAAVSCGYDHTAAIRTDNSLWMWGNNYYGQLGNNRTGDRVYIYEGELTGAQQAVPAKIINNIAVVACGDKYTAAIKTDGTVWTWGNLVGDDSRGNDIDAFSGNLIQTTPIQLDSLTASIGTQSGAGSAAGSDATPSDPGLTGSLETQLNLNGGVGGDLFQAAQGNKLSPTANPTKEGYAFGGWYVDEELTTTWNFNDVVPSGLTLYANWIPLSSTAATANKSQATFTLDGSAVTLDAYALKADSNGGDVTYVKLRDVAMLLNGTPAQFNVEWRDGVVYINAGAPYTTQNGTELQSIIGTDGSYSLSTSPILFDGSTAPLESIVLTDGSGGGHTLFKLRDLGAALGFNVGWSAERGIYIETDKPYSGT